MLSFGRGLQQVCSKSLVLPSLDLTRLLELLLDLQLLRLCSGRTKGRWGRVIDRAEEEEEEQPGEGSREEREREERGVDTDAETGRGRETENMLDRGGGGAVRRQTRRDEIVERDGGSS